MTDEISDQDKNMIETIVSAVVDARHRKVSPGLRIVGGTAYGSTVPIAGSEPVFRHPDPGCAGGGFAEARPSRLVVDPAATETAKNGKLREHRWKIWRMAEAATRYWRLRLKFSDAIECAQSMGIPEGSYHPIADPEDRRQSFEDRRSLVARWREALARQLLTPAPDAASVKWKQTALAAGDHEYTGVKTERIERAIADDLAFLAAHPVRQSNRRSAKAKDEAPAAQGGRCELMDILDGA
jgi:hypothetical protein